MSSKKSFSHANPAMSFISTPIVENNVQEQPIPNNTTVIKEVQESAVFDVPPSHVPMKRNPEFIEVKSKRMQLLMQPSLHQAIKKIADNEDISVNDKIHRILKDYVEQNLVTLLNV